jgi:pimeloyl-ACP methyl ester carboxylesterase
VRIALLLIALTSTVAAPEAAADRRPRAGAAKPRWESLPLPPPMPKAAGSGYVKVAGGAQIYYAQYGKASGPAVILLHGGLGNGDHFAHQVPALADRFRVIAIDSRGQGRSTLGQGKLGYPEMARDVVAVMDALEIERASMVGWSDGGAIALALGIEHAARVDRLFVFGTNYDRRGSKARSGPSPTFAAYAAKCRADFGRLARSPKTAYDAAARALAPVWRDPRAFTKQQLRSIKAPALVAGAAHDEIIVLDQVKEMAALIPNARLAVLADASHFAMWQDPAPFNKLLVELLTSPRAR